MRRDEPRSAQLTFRLPPSMRTKIEKRAERAHRSIGDMLVLLLDDALRRKTGWRR